MKAIVVHEAGKPEVLKIHKDWPMPKAESGKVLIRIKAFGLNRSEMYTRQGHSGEAVPFPRILGIECVGEVVEAPGTDLSAGQKVAAVMGDMGRAYDGGYAEYTLIPREHVLPFTSDLSWNKLAALPETFLTAYGSLVESMNIQAGQTLLIRGGTSSVGMAAITIAKDKGLTVIATTRNENKRDLLLKSGADHVIIDTGEIANKLKVLFPAGVNQVLELVGTKTLLDSLQCAAKHGIVCNTGILGDSWVLENFIPMGHIPSTVYLTMYSSASLDTAEATTLLQAVIDRASAGVYNLNIDRVFKFNEIVEAHTVMEESRATGKLIVMVD